MVRIGEIGDLIWRSAPAFRRESQVGRSTALAAIVAPTAGSPVIRFESLDAAGRSLDENVRGVMYGDGAALPNPALVLMSAVQPTPRMSTVLVVIRPPT